MVPNKLYNKQKNPPKKSLQEKRCWTLLAETETKHLFQVTKSIKISHS
jgi:hypothetical protein